MGGGEAGDVGSVEGAGDGGDKSDPIMAGEIPTIVFLPKPVAPPGAAFVGPGGRTAPATPMAPGTAGPGGAGAGAAAGGDGAGAGGPAKAPGATPIMVDFRFRGAPGAAPGWDGAPGKPGLPGTIGGTTAPAVTVPTFGAGAAPGTPRVAGRGAGDAP